MADFEMDKTAEAASAQEIAQDLDALRTLTARYRHLAPTAQAAALRALLGKREALLGSISARMGLPTPSEVAAGAVAAPTTAGAQNAAFAQTLRDVAIMDRESQAALSKRTDEAADEVLKLRAAKKWRQSNTR